MKKRDLLVIVAIIFFIISPSLAFYITPSMKRLPKDLNEVIYYDGKLSIFNENTLEIEQKDIRITRYIRALGEEDGVLIVREDIEVKDKKTNEELPEFGMTKVYGINPHTTENIAGYGDLDRLGQWLFPVGVKKKNYLVWNTDLDDACKAGYIEPDEAVSVAHYMGEEKRAGIKTYKYYGSQENVFVGYLPTLPEAKMYYGGEIFAWVEPNTGTIVDLQKHVSQYAAFPDLHKMPSNLNMSVYLKGIVTILNTTNAQYENYNVTICNHVEVENATDEYYLVKNEVIATDEHGKKINELCSVSIDAVDPYTMEYIEILSDKRGMMNFPIGVDKKDYLLWDSNINNVTVAEYRGEEEIAGLKVYKFVSEIKNYYIGEQSIDGLSDRSISLYYDGNTTYYVEPTSGGIAYIEREGQVSAVFPDLHTIPENFAGEVKMEGKLWILSQEKNIEMDRKLGVEKVYWEDGKKVLVIKDETTTYDEETGEKIDMACKTEYHGIYADTAEEARNYGDMEREGIYTFPLGTEKRDYVMWNTEINAPSLVEFVREEDHNGIHTYLFETREDRIVKDTTLGMPLNVRYITTTRYWVEPNTGLIIDMEKESVKKTNVLDALLGMRGIFWFDVYRLSLHFSEETQQEMAEQAEQMMELVKLSNSKVPALKIHVETSDIIKSVEDAKMLKKQIEKLSGKKVKVVDLVYWMTERSVNEMINEAKKATFLLYFMQIILPAFLILLGLIMIAAWLRR